jgi:O-antigen ligase
MAGIVMRMIRTDADLLFVLRAIVVTALLSALLGIAQSAAFVVFGLELHRMDDDSPRFIQVFGYQMLRAPGLLQNPQAFCHALSFGFMLTIYGWLAGSNDRSRWNPLVWASILVMATAILLSFARGAWASVAIGLLLLPAMAWPRHAFHWFVGLSALALIATWTGALTYALSAYRSFTLSTAEVRVELLASGLQALAEHPWRGVGMANFESYAQTSERLPVHNALVQVASETGIPGLLAYLAILGLPMARALRALRYASGGRSHLLRAMLLAYFVYMIAIQGEPSGYSELVYFFAALLYATARIAEGMAASVAMPTSKAVS